ncbi:MAG: hypothetical protein HY914_18680 [Desulfomonile tiedjei]|nr:hypothetical protein [Desulfomonile tiedjei]
MEDRSKETLFFGLSSPHLLPFAVKTYTTDLPDGLWAEPAYSPFGMQSSLQKVFLRASSRVQRSHAKDVDRFAVVKALITLLIVFVCTLRLMGCVPAFLGGKASSKKPENKTERAELMKPQLPEASESSDPKVEADRKPSSAAAESGSPGSSEGVSEASRPSTRDAGAGNQETSAPSERASRDGSEGSDRKGEKQPIRPTPSEASEKPGKSGSNDASKEAEGAGKEELFKKHDHEKYVESLKNKAIDQVNRDGKCDYARLCRNSVTDERSLTLYYMDGKTFSFVTYEWDEIDEKWKKDYTSNKWPMSQWEEHLKLAAARQDCTVIKGSGRQTGSSK